MIKRRKKKEGRVDKKYPNGEERGEMNNIIEGKKEKREGGSDEKVTI